MQALTVYDSYPCQHLRAYFTLALLLSLDWVFSSHTTTHGPMHLYIRCAAWRIMWVPLIAKNWQVECTQLNRDLRGTWRCMHGGDTPRTYVPSQLAWDLITRPKLPMASSATHCYTPPHKYILIHTKVLDHVMPVLSWELVGMLQWWYTLSKTPILTKFM